MITVVSTDGLPAREREEYWRQVMSETFVPLTVGETGGQALTGSIRSQRAGRLMVAQVASTAQDIHRTPRLISHTDAAYFQVALVTRGAGRVAQDGRDAVLRPGDFAVYETTRPFQWAFGEEWEASVFTIPQSSVQLTEPERRLLTARRLDGGAGMTGVVSRFLRDLGRHCHLVSEAQSERVTAQAADLVVSLLDGYTAGNAVVRSSVQRSLLVTVKDHIDRRLADPALRPAEIAAEASISLRYLHKLFAAEDCSVSEYIKQRRLQRCRRDLLDPRLARQSIAVIAFRWGFGDLSGFNRAFKATFGMTPRDLRGRAGAHS